jgi:hypothetical protein
MTASKGYYSLIQFCPDLSRLEAANVGVLMFCPDKKFLKAKTARGNDRIRHFFGSKSRELKQINSFKKGIEERLGAEKTNILTLDELNTFIATRANELQITPPRPMKVRDPEKELEALFQELVGGRPRKDRESPFSRLLGTEFEKAGIENKIMRDVPLNVPILERDIKFPYAFQNGRLNLIQPARFESSNPTQTIDTACRYAVEGESLFDNPSPQYGSLQLIVVGRFKAKNHKAKQSVQRVLENHKVRLFAQQELRDLIDEIRKTGKVITA